MRRNLVLGGMVGAVVLAAAVGWLFGSRIRSPADIAAEAAPPPASNITVPVVRQLLTADVITRGDIVFDDPVSVALSGSFAEIPEKLVVTQAVDVNDDLDEGAMAVEVTGRPVFLLTGEIPMYRDLRPGASGDDVLQLEESLITMGYLTPPAGNTWDDDTGVAVAAWYQEAGYRANGLSRDDETRLRAARDRVRGAENALADAQASLREAQQGSGQAAIAAARAEVSAAQDALALARLDAQRANEVAAQELASAVDALKAGMQADPPLPADELAALEKAVDEAEFSVERTTLEQQALVDAASARVSVALAALTDAQRGVDSTSIRRHIDTSAAELSLARTELAELEAELGTWLPAGEIVFLRRLPVRIDQVHATRGSIIEGPFITVSGADLALRSSVPERDAPRIEEGMTVLIENPNTAEDISGVIAEKAARPGTHGLTSDRVYIEIIPDELPEDLVGANVRVVIPVSSTGGEVLAVPAAALSATANGSTIIQVESGDGTLTTIKVETGLAAGGLVEVTPLDGALTEGDLVVVGRSDGSTTTAPEEPSDEA